MSLGICDLNWQVRVCYEVPLRLNVFCLFYVCRSWVLESSTFEFGPLLLETAFSAFVLCRCSFAIWPVCFDISEDDRITLQTVDTHFWSQLLFWLWKLFHNFFTFIFFFAIKSTSVLFLFSCQFLRIFASNLNLIVRFKVFMTRKFENVQEFNRVRALI